MSQAGILGFNPSGGFVTSITGNTGPAQTGAIHLVTANATPIFAGAGGTITLDFGLRNLFIGTLPPLAGADENVAIGFNAGLSITSGTGNVIIGFDAGTSLTDGLANVIIGDSAMSVSGPGTNENVAVGYSSLLNLSGGTENTAVGFQSMNNLVDGTSNVAIGFNAGSSYNAFESDNITILNSGVTGDQGVIRIGTDSLQTTCFITGIDAVDLSTANVVTEVSDQLGTAVLTAGSGISITPGAGVITIAATGAGNPVTTLHTQDGNNVTATAGVVNLSGGNSLTTTGTAGPNTATISLTGITQYNVQTGGASNALHNVSPSATSGVPLISQGAASQPIFGTAVVAGGGTGAVSFTAHGVILGEGTSPLGVTAAGTTGQVLTGVTGSDPVWASPAASSISITGNSGGALTGNAFTFTGGTTGLTFAGAGTTETLGGTLVVANGGTGSATFNTTGVVISGATSTTALTSVTLTDGQLAIGSSAGNPAAATLSAGAGIAISNGHNSITISATGTTTLTVTSVAHAASPYTVLTTDEFLAVNVSGGVVSILLPNAPATGRVYYIKDSTGGAATSNITVTTVGGAVNIDGATSFVMNTAYESISVIFDGAAYEVF